MAPNERAALHFACGILKNCLSLSFFPGRVKRIRIERDDKRCSDELRRGRFGKWRGRSVPQDAGKRRL